MILYNIINPSDPYTIESPSLDVLATASLLLGHGEYGFQPIIDENSVSEDGRYVPVPIMAFSEPDEWCEKHFGETLMEMSNRVMDTKLAEVATCLDSVLYGDAQDREEFYAVTTNMDSATFIAHRAIEQEKKCSSLNDIGARAYRMAAKLRESIAAGLDTTQ